MTRNLGTLAASIVSVVVLGMVMSKYLPYVPVFSHMILTPPGSPDMAHMAEPQLRPENVVEPGGNGAPTVGVVGTASTMLRPAGKAQIDGRYVDVVTEGGYIPQGSAIEVVDVSGSHIVVRQT
jgi:membrane-bound serine protease (ClpP class)